MPKKSAKQQNIQTISLHLNGGLNYADAPANIGDNELTRALNIIYNAQSGTPETRPGTSCCMSAACSGTSPILAGYYYEKSASTKYHVAACGGKLWYRSGTGLASWTEIGSLNDSTTVPSFLTFNAKLLIADGGTNIKTWDGTTYSALSDGLTATSITTIKNRVVVNSTGSPDLVTMSGPNDETKWNTSTEGAVGIRVGFGDNMVVKGFAVMGDDLIVAKTGDSNKRLYRVNVADATETNWYAKKLSDNNSAQNGHCLATAFNNCYFVDSNGFKTLKGVTEYGDLQIDAVGNKINALVGSSACDQVVYIPQYSSVWFLLANRIFCYNMLVDKDGNIQDAFTEMIFGFGRVRFVYQAGAYVYLCGNDGYLYKLDDSVATDASGASTTASYQSIITSKEFSFLSEGILRKTQLYLNPLKTGTAILSIITPSSSVTLKTISLGNAGTEIASMTGYISTYTGYIYDMGETNKFICCYNRARGSSLQYSLATTSGRVGLEKLIAEFAMVGA